jgi:hypothetical protein
MTSDAEALIFPLKPDELIEHGAFNPEALAKLHRWQKPAVDAASSISPTAPVSIGIPTWVYGHEPPTPLVRLHAKYFENSIREDGLLAVALYGVLYAPGKAGTLQEVFQDAAQNYYPTAGGFSPTVFLDIDQSWSTRIVLRRFIIIESGSRRLFGGYVRETARIARISGNAGAIKTVVQQCLTGIHRTS